MVADRKVINQKYYAANLDARLLKNAVKSIIAGRRPWASTLKRFELGERDLNRIRSLDARFRTILEDKHGVELESLYKGKAPLPEMRLPDVQVIEPVPAPKYDYKQGLEEVPPHGTNTPITWAQIHTFWSGDVNVHQMGSSAARMIMKDGVLVHQKYPEKTKKTNRATFEQFRVHFGQKPDDNAIPFLRKIDDIKRFLREIHTKTAAQLEADATVQDSSVGAVAGRDDDDDEEVSSGGVQLTKSSSGTKVRARDKSSALKDVTPSY
jgi:hypothetical protein